MLPGRNSVFQRNIGHINTSCYNRRQKEFPKNTEEKVTEVIGGSTEKFIIIRQSAQLDIHFIYIICFKYFKEIKCFKEIKYTGRNYKCGDKKNELVSNYGQKAEA